MSALRSREQKGISERQDKTKNTQCSRRVGVVLNYLEKGAALGVLHWQQKIDTGSLFSFFISIHRISESSEPLNIVHWWLRENEVNEFSLIARLDLFKQRIFTNSFKSGTKI